MTSPESAAVEQMERARQTIESYRQGLQLSMSSAERLWLTGALRAAFGKDGLLGRDMNPELWQMATEFAERPADAQRRQAAGRCASWPVALELRRQWPRPDDDHILVEELGESRADKVLADWLFFQHYFSRTEADPPFDPSEPKNQRRVVHVFESAEDRRVMNDCWTNVEGTGRLLERVERAVFGRDGRSNFTSLDD